MCVCGCVCVCACRCGHLYVHAQMMTSPCLAFRPGSWSNRMRRIPGVMPLMRQNTVLWIPHLLKTLLPAHLPGGCGVGNIHLSSFFLIQSSIHPLFLFSTYSTSSSISCKVPGLCGPMNLGQQNLAQKELTV